MPQLRPRLLRQQLSSRYQVLRRQSSAARSRPSFLRRNYGSIAASTLALLLGLGAGNVVVHFLAPPPMPHADTHEDRVLMADLNKRIDEDFKVKVLRGKCLGVARALKGKEGGWVELVPPVESQTDGLSGKEETHLTHHLRGARGLGVERIFYSREDEKLVAVVYFGPDLSGWPGVTHGGLLATALDEKISLAHRLATASAHAEPTHLSIDYTKPTHANAFYVIRVSPAWATEENVRIPVEGHDYFATLERTDGTVCVRATAKFAAGGARRAGMQWHAQAQDGVKWTYDEFRQWLWPSRQKQSQA